MMQLTKDERLNRLIRVANAQQKKVSKADRNAYYDEHKVCMPVLAFRSEAGEGFYMRVRNIKRFWRNVADEMQATGQSEGIPPEREIARLEKIAAELESE